MGALESAKVCSRRRLAEVWSSRPEFLREELEGWIRKGRGALLDTLWPVMLQEAKMGAEAAARKRKKSRKAKEEQAKRGMSQGSSKAAASAAASAAKKPSSGGSSLSGGKWIM